jgi:hypothetical protein
MGIAMRPECWNRVFDHAMRELERLRRRVREGVSVEDAQAFGRFIQWSGICGLMSDNPPETVELRQLFPYDGAQLRSEADSLVAECCEYYRGRTRNSEGTAKGASKSDLEAIDAKLVVIMSRLDALESGQSALRVVPSEESPNGLGEARIVGRGAN